MPELSKGYQLVEDHFVVAFVEVVEVSVLLDFFEGELVADGGGDLLLVLGCGLVERDHFLLLGLQSSAEFSGFQDLLT